MRNVVITGLGIVSPIGNNVEDFWKNTKKGTSGIDNITLFDTKDSKVTLAAEVKDFDLSVDCPDIKNQKRLERFSRFALAASTQAIKDSGLDLNKEDLYRIGTSIASGMGSTDLIYNTSVSCHEKGSRGVPPLVIPMVLSNMASANVAIYHKLKGKNINVVTACASGNNSIGEALRTIQYGDADVMVAGGSEANINPLAIFGFAALGALNTNTDKDRASIPFDAERSGFVMGEGAGVLVLEEEEHAKKRGAKIYARLMGYGNTCDAYHITSPLPDGTAQSRCMLNAISDAGIKPNNVDYINAHGTSTKYNDLFETNAIKLTFGEHSKDLLINSTKSMVGHLLGGAGGVEAVATTLSLYKGYVHKTINYKVKDPECDLNYCTEKGVDKKIRYAISNGFGFGGHNSTLTFGVY